MKEKLSVKGIWEVLKNSFTGMGEHKITKMSGSLAYYTVFSMAPLLIMIISLCGIFLGREAVEGEVYAQLKNFVGADTAAQMQDIVKHASLAGKSKIAAIIGGVMLLLGATTVFAEIQDSINTIWGLKPKPKLGLMKMLKNRFLSFSVIASLGFLLLVSFGVTAVIDGLSDRLKASFPDVTIVIFNIINIIITLIVSAAIFAVIFKVLPDANIKWKDVLAGAIFTSLLFMVGRFGISFYISKSDIGSTYGTAGSLVVLLLWVYYSSIILYFGAEFTKAYNLKYGSEIHPNEYAVTTKNVEVESGNESVQSATESSKKLKGEEEASTNGTPKAEAGKAEATMPGANYYHPPLLLNVQSNSSSANNDHKVSTGKKVALGLLAASAVGTIVWTLKTKKGKETKDLVIRNSKNLAAKVKAKVDTVKEVLSEAKEGAEGLLEQVDRNKSSWSSRTDLK